MESSSTTVWRLLASITLAVTCGAAWAIEGPLEEALAAGAPQSAAVERCPYDFGGAMPAATFCVYNGVALGPEGEVCAEDVLVIWSSYAVEAISKGEASPGNGQGEVYLGFVSDPELVIRAVVDPERTGRAVMVGYTLGEGEAPLPLVGETKLRATTADDPNGKGSILTIKFQEPRRFRPAGCTLQSYAGTFVGIVELPMSSEEFVESDINPRP